MWLGLHVKMCMYDKLLCIACYIFGNLDRNCLHTQWKQIKTIQACCEILILVPENYADIRTNETTGPYWLILGVYWSQTTGTRFIDSRCVLVANQYRFLSQACKIHGIIPWILTNQVSISDKPQGKHLIMKYWFHGAHLTSNPWVPGATCQRVFIKHKQLLYANSCDHTHGLKNS